MDHTDLAALREAAGYTQADLAREIGASETAVSRYERGISVPRGRTKREKYARALKISLADLNGCFTDGEYQVGNGDDEQDWLRPGFSMKIGLEQSATSLDSYEPHVIHGLLQTEEYARALIEREIDDPGRVERLVAFRLSRQSVLTKKDPLNLLVVLGEGALRLKVDSSAVMRDQLRHVVELADRPNVTLRLLPFSAGPHTADRGAFDLITLPWVEDGPAVVYLETYIGPASYIEFRKDIRFFSDLFTRLRSMSLSEEDSIAMIREAEETHP